MPNVGDELHHFGWNRCSSACHGPDRSHLIVPGFRSSRIHIVNVADDPRRPRIEKVIEPRGARREDGLHAPAHGPLHAGRQHRHQHARRRRRQRRRRLRGARRAHVRGQGPLGERRPDAAAELRLLVPAAQERAGLVGVRRAERLRAGLRHRRRRRRALRAAAALLEPRRAAARADARPRRAGLVPLEVRWLHDPEAEQGFVGATLSSNDRPLPPHQRQLPGRAGDRGRQRRARGLAAARRRARA